MKDIVKKYNKSCYGCGSYTTWRSKKDGRDNWYTNKPTNLYFCSKCYRKYISNPKIDKSVHLLNNKRKHPRRITFKGKRFLLPYNPRTGCCSWCNNKTPTNLHHKEYYIIFKWFATIELCDSCHSKEGWKIGELHATRC